MSGVVIGQLAYGGMELLGKLHLVLEAEGGRAICTAQAALAPAITQRDTGAVIAALNQLAADVAARRRVKARAAISRNYIGGGPLWRFLEDSSCTRQVSVAGLQATGMHRGMKPLMGKSAGYWGVLRPLTTRQESAGGTP